MTNNNERAIQEMIEAVEENITAVEDYLARLRAALAALKGDDAPSNTVEITVPLDKRVWEWLAEAFGYPIDEIRGVVERWYADEMANEESMRVSER